MSRRTSQYWTLAHICGTVQLPYHHLQKVCEELKIRPAMMLNLCGYFTDAQVDRIVNAAIQKKATRKSKK